MDNNKNISLLKENIDVLLDAVRWLKRSYNICSSLESKESFSEEEFDSLEAMSARYSRVIDILIQKVFRSIDHIEMEKQGSIIDVVNRAEKRGIICSVDQVREMKDLRNEVAHEYITDELDATLKDIIKMIPKLLRIVDKTIEYCARHI
jgi:uncharacterized protein YutE (UPF0331/DUF86 family)